MGYEKYQCEKPEDINYGEQYALTINPCDKPHQYFNANSARRAKDFHKNASEHLEKLFSPTYCRIKLKLEISKKGRLHYHGWISFTDDDDIRNFFLVVVRKLQDFCTFDLHKIVDKKVDGKKFDGTWKQYVNKQSLFNSWLNINQGVSKIRY